ncbi:NUDIX domain-containing protein [Patescibacteria group bacterium]|nr:NUDIX domain-containing protein [Patescibacteria group bacterium]
MIKTSYGILVFKRDRGNIYVLLAHPGGPFYQGKDLWTIPKGEPDGSEDNITTAKREFHEETGVNIPGDELIDLGSLAQSAVKINRIWAVHGNPDLTLFSSNEFELEWPPRSGKIQHFPEIDRIAWFTTDTARMKLFPKQTGFIDRLESALASASADTIF